MSKKYYVSELFPNYKFTAAVGRHDLEWLLSSWGFDRLYFAEEKKGLHGKIITYVNLIRFIRKIKRGDTVLFHFPVYSRVKRFLLKALRRRGINCIAYVNDIEGLRDRNLLLLKQELKTLSTFSGAIVLNKTMQQYVAGQCPNLRLSAITIWDYLAPERQEKKRSKTATVAFAGNQQKAAFIERLDKVKNVNFHLYGTSAFAKYPANCVVHGETDPKALPTEIQGSFGLVWDGPSVESCEGGEGEYLRINSPYKLSLYLLAGLPVIIWKEAALAGWITSNRFGIEVDNLNTLHCAIEQLTEAEYQDMVQHIKTVQPLIASGQFLKKALEEQLKDNR